MPKLHVRKPGDVPPPSRPPCGAGTTAKFDDFVRGYVSDVGDLELEAENLRSVEVRRASLVE
jgi:hypothetical protein